MKTKPPTHPLAALAASVGFPVTLCVLAYGRNASLAERFLTSLYRNTNPALFHLRAGLNEVEPKTRALFEDHASRFKNLSLFIEPKNVFKSPLMRRMFWRPGIKTPWTIWCDDDTHFTRPDWLQRLGTRIECSPEVMMWGQVHSLWVRSPVVLDWIKAAAWYRGLPFLRGVDLEGREAAEFRFPTGGFWAIRTSVLRQLNWPDPRLVQASDDFLLAEALRQNDLLIGSFEYGVKINDAARRNAGAVEIRQLVLPLSQPGKLAQPTA